MSALNNSFPTLTHKSTQSNSSLPQNSYICRNLDIEGVEVTTGWCGEFRILHPRHKFHKVHLKQG